MADVRMTSQALASLERGEAVHTLELHSQRVDAEHVAAVASNEFWLICAHALRAAARTAAPNDDRYEGAYELLVASLGIVLPEEPHD